MMSIAPQSVSSNLRMMSDAQLAQYAQMHQHDPYIFPLAFQESQDRKNMRSEAMAKQSGQAQPPVVQQDLAQMMPQQAPQQAPQQPQQVAQLPEEQGIGALPAQNLQRMAGGGITGEQHYADKGLVQPVYGYTATTAADLPKNVTPEQVAEYTKKMQQSAEEGAAPEQAKTAALFDPYIQKLKGKQADIDEKKNTNTQMALLQAGLGMLGGTSPYAFANIAKGGQEGVAAYVSGKKSIQDSQDLLDHSQFLAEQAKNSALKGDVKDQATFQNAAVANLMAGKNLEYHGLQILNSSKAEEGKLRAEQESNSLKRSQLGIEAGKAESLKGLQDAERQVWLSKIPTAEQTKVLNVQKIVDRAIAPIRTQQAKLSTPGTEQWDKYEKQIHQVGLPIWQKHGIEPPPEVGASYVPPEEEGHPIADFFSGLNPFPSKPAGLPTLVPNAPQTIPGPVPGGPPSSNQMTRNPPGVKFLGFEPSPQ